MKVPLCRPSIGREEIEEVVRVLESGWLAHGEHNHRFEEAFAKYIGVEHAISLNSCTSALELALKVAGIRGEVVLPSMTFVASANSVVTSGGTPVFCEVDPRTRNVDAALLEEKITSRTEAVMVVHFGGQPCPMTDIVALCEKRGLFLIEDSAETLGATWKGKQAGSFGAACFSFFPTKNITTGEGGMLTTRDADFARRARALMGHGIMSTTAAREKEKRPWVRAAEMAGHNYRMPNPLAAIGYHQLRRLDELNGRRIALARRYDEALAPLAPRLRIPMVLEGATHVYQMYTVEVDEALRDDFVLGLREAGVGASVHFDPPVHVQPRYAGSPAMPVTEALAQRLVTLPMYPDMSTAELEHVVAACRKLLDRPASRP
jgi:perosamine synthetase